MSSAATRRPRPSRLPSGRPSSSLEDEESGQNGDTARIPSDQRFTEEIEEIKRYEDFTTIDWVQDAAREQVRRSIRKKENFELKRRSGFWNVKQKIWELYDAGEAWIVVTLVGIAIGVNAAVLNIVTEWMSDIKLGYCETAFYLNRNFCCWGVDNPEDGCPEWHAWSGIYPVNWLLYSLFAALFAFTSASLVKAFAPYAAGSGISEIKCIIAGFVMKGFLGFWTLLIKSIALPLAIASGLSVGKEGPSVHYAVCTGNVISRLFTKYKRNAAKTREILSACAAAGVAVAFGSPVGGVLFSLEEMSSYFPLKTMWRSYFCALVATAVLAGMNPFRTGQLVMFTVHYDRSWHLFEVPFFILLGIFGGLYGAFVIKWNLRAQSFRKKYLTKFAVPEAVVLTVLTAIVCYPNMFLRIDMTELMEALFLECEGAYDFHGLCENNNRWHMVISLAWTTVLRTLLVIISYGCKVPAGIFVPSMAIGASFGRMVGILVQALHDTYPFSPFFAACEPDVPCITPGTYAFLGAGAALSGIMHITVSVVVIMFELTGALTYILPTMIVVGTTKAVSSYFPAGGIADRMIYFNGFPFLDNKEQHAFHVSVSKTMTPASSLALLPARGLKLSDLTVLLSETSYSGFPVVSDTTSRILLGYIGRTELAYAIAKAKSSQLISPDASCIFSSSQQTPAQTPASSVPPISFDDIASASGTQTIDFSRFADTTPLTVHPHLPLETAMEIFKKMGPRIILIEHKGRLDGLVTVKDCLKYQFQVEAHERGDGNGVNGTRAERFEKWLWSCLVVAGTWVGQKVGRVSGGRIRLNADSGSGGDASAVNHSSEARGLLVGDSRDPRDSRMSIQGEILEGTEGDPNDEGQELQER